MKRLMTVRVEIELTSERPTGLDEAAEEALSHLSCDIMFHSVRNGAYGAKLISKDIQTQDEDRLFEIILETTGVTEKEFRKSTSREAATVRHLFSFYAKKYLEWSHNRIAYAIGRDRSTVSDGIKSIVDVLTKNPQTNQGQRKLSMIRGDMELIQRKWGETKR